MLAKISRAALRTTMFAAKVQAFLWLAIWSLLRLEKVRTLTIDMWGIYTNANPTL